MYTKKQRDERHKGRAAARKIVSEIGDIDKGLVVHHIDGDPTNNKHGNLILLTKSNHYKIHLRAGGKRPSGRRRKRISFELLESLISQYNDNI